MICSIVPHTSYSHYFKAAPVYPHNLVTTCLYKSDLSHLQPRLNVPVLPALTEVVEEVHQTELHHQVSELLAAQVLGFANVGAEVLWDIFTGSVSGPHPSPVSDPRWRAGVMRQ